MYRHFKNVLPNGLRVVTVEAPPLHAAMLAAYVRCGSRHETPEVNGVSHFLEHMFFRGCRRYPEGRRMNALVEDAGGSLNGVTTRDHGYFYTPLHPGGLATGMETLGAMLGEPLLNEVDLEREVILEEMLDEVDDRGRDIDIDNIVKREAYGAHPLAYKIAGTEESVRAMRRDTLAEHHRRRYVAPNMVLACAGPVTQAEVMELAARHFSAFPGGEPVRDDPPPPWPQGPRLVEVRHDESQTEFRFTFPVPPETHPDFPALMVLRRVLDDGLSSRLQVNVVDRKGLAYSVHAGFDTWSDAGMVEFDAACAHAKVPATAAEILRTVGELVRAPVPEEELARARLRHRIGLEFSLDSASELAGWFGGTELFHEPESYEERVRKVDAVTAADVQRVAAETFRTSRLLFASVGRLDRPTRKELERIVVSGDLLPE